MNKVEQKWVDSAKRYVQRYSEATTEKAREDVLWDLL